jgi:hypothetical protein
MRRKTVERLIRQAVVEAQLNIELLGWDEKGRVILDFPGESISADPTRVLRELGVRTKKACLVDRSTGGGGGSCLRNWE